MGVTLRLRSTLIVTTALLLCAARAHNDAHELQAADYRLEVIENPVRDAALLDLGHHVRVRLWQEGVATSVEIPVRPELLRAADLATLRLARFDSTDKRYMSPVEIAWEPGRPARATTDRSGDYSILGLPADPIGKTAIGALCGIEGRTTPATLDPICKVILCQAFDEMADPSAFMGSGEIPGGPGGGPTPGSGSVCERCTGLGGRVPSELGECLLNPPHVPLDPGFPKRPVLPFCQTRPSLIADPSVAGPYPVASTEYKFVDAIDIPPNDPDTDVWASVRYPGTSAGPDAPIAAGVFPLVAYLHGNHGIFISGGNHVCSPTTPTPVPNHDGYNYVLDRLASRGFIAISINANDLNCKSDRIVERGKLILEHLRRWKDFNNAAVADATFKGRFYNHVDMNRIGLAGHSRGGEAVISAYLENQSSALGFGIKAIHSIAPVDFKSFTLVDVPYYVLLPAADGDVSTLHGLRIYDRAAPRTDPSKMPKMQSHVYGANHNWFNTVWFQDDGSGPNRLTDVNQRVVERVLGVAFFRQFLQGYTTARGLFTGTARVGSAVLSAEIYRSYQDPTHKSVDDFEDAPSDPLLNSLGGTNVTASLTPFNEFPFSAGGGAFNASFFHDTKGLVNGWNASSDTLTLNVPAKHKDVSAFRLLSFRVAQVLDATNPTGGVQDMDVGLEDELGNTIFFRVGAQDVIPFPYQRPSSVKTVLQTVRIGLSCYSCSSAVGIDRTAIARIRFRFNRTPTGILGLDSIQFSR